MTTQAAQYLLLQELSLREFLKVMKAMLCLYIANDLLQEPVPAAVPPVD